MTNRFQVLLFRLLPALVLLPLAACVSKAPVENAPVMEMPAEQPVWVSQLPQRAGYVYGIGSAEIYTSASSATSRAQEQARVDLLSRLQVRVSSETRVQSQMQTRNGELTDLHDLVMQQISSQVEDITLPGIQVIQTWTSPDGGTVWALAELNQRAAEDQLLTQLANVDQRILARPLPPAANSKLDRVRAVVPALADLAERQAVIKQLDFLSAVHRIDGARNQQVEAYQGAVRALLSSLNFRLVTANEAARQMLPTLAATLTSMGFRLQEQAADLTLVLQLNTTSVQRNALYHEVAQAQAQVQLADGRVIYSIEQQGRAVSSDAQVARQRAATSLAEMLGSQLAEGLYERL